MGKIDHNILLYVPPVVERKDYMKRVAFLDKVKTECELEYIKRHDNIWPELVKEYKNAGIVSMTVFMKGVELLIKETILVRSFNGEFFTDNEVRRDSKLYNPNNSASCNHGFASHVIYWLSGIFEKSINN